MVRSPAGSAPALQLLVYTREIPEVPGLNHFLHKMVQNEYSFN